MSGSGAFSTGGGGVLTVTRALAFAEPPGPLAVIVYDVESAGGTFADPSGFTGPPPGGNDGRVSFVDSQPLLHQPPFLTEHRYAASTPHPSPAPSPAPL